jgi:hypothetical protein
MRQGVNWARRGLHGDPPSTIAHCTLHSAENTSFRSSAGTLRAQTLAYLCILLQVEKFNSYIMIYGVVCELRWKCTYSPFTCGGEKWP